MKPYLPALICLGLLAACAQKELADYRPVIDPAQADPVKFETDLAACRSVATQAQAQYKAQEDNLRSANMVGGLVAGAVLGVLIGDSRDGAAIGAAYGTVAGASGSDHELIENAPRRIIDRCMENRGYDLLNDFGRG